MPILIQPGSSVAPTSVPVSARAPEDALRPPARGTAPLAATGTSLSARGGETTLTPEVAMATLKLSGAMLALSAASQLPIPSGYETAFALLSLDDRALLGFASQLAEKLGLPTVEVSKLLIDLCSYRLLEARASRLEPNVAQVSALEPGGQVTSDRVHRPPLAERLVLLPELSARNEAIARTILGSLAMRDTALDRGFVANLLDPARDSPAKVDFQFLRSLVLSSSRAHADGALDPTVSFVARDVRAVLARTVQNLAELLVLRPDVSPRSLREGHRLLATRLAEPLPAAPEQPRALLARAPLPDLTVEDREVLSLLYATAKAQGGKLEVVDELAHALADVRRAETPALQTAAGRLAAPIDRVAEQQRSAPTASVEAQRVATRALGAAPAAPNTNEIVDSPPHENRELRLPLRMPSNVPTVETELPISVAPAHRPQAEPQLPELARTELASFQSLAHLAARSVSAYRSVAPPDVARAPMAVSSPPLDLAQALGVSALLRGAQAQPLRRKRARRKRASFSDENHHSHETEAHESADPRGGTHSRWQLLHARRRRILSSAGPTR